jgi:hypothetical protein
MMTAGFVLIAQHPNRCSATRTKDRFVREKGLSYPFSPTTGSGLGVP